jgi:dTDP-4-amino-4,6-dideoxygalactose transaminase
MSTKLKEKIFDESVKNIPFIDLKLQQNKIRIKIDKAIKRVLDHGKYIMGPEVFELEEKLAEFSKVKNVVTCSSGTDALLMVLMAKGIGPGDAVFLPSFTYTATPEVVAILGATPIFVDVFSDTYNIDHNNLQQSIFIAKKNDLEPKAIIAVDLFGQPSDYNALEHVANKNNLWILSDAAQSFGGEFFKKRVGSLGHATATSFFPAKPLGCYGDGGAVFTDDDELADIVRSIRLHGKGEHKYDNVRIGLNARLDTIQAAILIEKMQLFDEELKERQDVASYYNKMLKHIVQVPYVINDTSSAWAQYTIQVPNINIREVLINNLKTKGIPSMIYYEKPLHLQTAYKHFPKSNSLKVSEDISKRVLSLPISLKHSSYIVEKFCEVYKNAF